MTFYTVKFSCTRGSFSTSQTLFNFKEPSQNACDFNTVELVEAAQQNAAVSVISLLPLLY